jgi:hypothetical protein
MKGTSTKSQATAGNQASLKPKYKGERLGFLSPTKKDEMYL